MSAFFPVSQAQVLGDTVLLNRAVYGGNLELPDAFLDDYDPARDPSDAGIRSALNTYDRYDLYLEQFGFETLGADELGFDPADVSFTDDDTPGDGAGIDQNWFYNGDLYRNHHVQQPDGSTTVFEDAAAVAIAAVRQEGERKTLHLVFRGTDADLGSDGEAGTGPGQVRYYGQLKPLIDQVRAYIEDGTNGITDIVVSGQSLGGSMVDLFALYDGAAFDAIAGVDLTVVALASAGVDPVTLQLMPDFDASLVAIGSGGAVTFDTPDWYVQYGNFNDIVRNPERYDFAQHAQNDPEQAPITNAAVSTLLEHIEFTEQRLEIESPLLDQYAAAATLETTFLPEHYASYYELLGLGIAEASTFVPDLDFDRIIALGGINPNITETSGTNNANGFGVPEDNTADFSTETGDLLVMGLSGNDMIVSGSGADLLAGGTGNDDLDGGAGADVLAGGTGNDTLRGGDGDDILHGGIGNDLLIAGSGGDLLDGEDGDDRLRGNSGSDTLIGGDGDDRLDGASGGDVLNGDAGEDFIEGEGGNDILNGGSDSDTVRGGGGFDRVDGSDGDDRVEGNSGNDTVDGGDGADVVTGGGGNDILSGGRGSDFLNGNAGDDTLDGGAGGDSLSGSAGRDMLFGGASNDTLNGGRDADILTGGEGKDVFVFTANGGNDTVTDFTNNADTLAIDDGLYDDGLTARQVVDAFGSDIAGGVRFGFGGGDVLDVLGDGITTGSIVNDILL